ncbi:MAG: phosphotransferase [Armatimonadetes bacterium]|nr:phosphotransferase [Armatimonadota bacterium]
MLPEHLKATIRGVWKANGAAWLGRFDEVLSEACSKWALKEVAPFPELSYHFVARATREGLPVVLKLGVPEPWMESEAAALGAFGGDFAAELLDFEPSLAALLMEDLSPGVRLDAGWSPQNDDEQTTILARTMLGLAHPHPQGHRFQSTMDLSRTVREPKAGVPEDLRLRAVEVWDELERSAPDSMLLHGDLHHGNVLSCGEGFKAIDPMGVVGDPAFEAYCLLHNPAEASPLLQDLWPTRLKVVADMTGLDPERLRLWGFCGSVMSCCWDVEDGSAPSPSTLGLARSLLQA